MNLIEGELRAHKVRKVKNLLRGAGAASRDVQLRVRAFPLRAVGFKGPTALAWIADKDRSRASKEYTSAEVRSALRHGYQPGTVRKFGPRTLTSVGVSERDYWFAHPLNGNYSKWVDDRISTRVVFYPFVQHLEPADFHILFRGSQLLFIPISQAAKGFPSSYEGLAEFLRQSGPRELVSSEWASTYLSTVAAGDQILLNGEPADARALTRKLRSAKVGESFVVRPASASRAGETLRVLLINAVGSDPQVVDAQLDVPASGLTARVDVATGSYRGGRRLVEGRIENDPDQPSGQVQGWEQTKQLLLDMGHFAPQLEFVEFTLTWQEGAWQIVGVSSDPAYPTLFPFTQPAAEFLKGRIARKHSEHADRQARTHEFKKNSRMKLRRWFGQAFYPKGLVPYQSVRWLGDVGRDLRSGNPIPLKQKLWSYRNGLLSYRLPQYGIDRVNREQFISDLEYRWIRHVNSQYRYWLEDKISIKYVAADYNHLFPKYYFYTSNVSGETHVVPMMDLPEGYEATASDILRLVRDVGVVALKPEEGSHGDGFYRLEYAGGGYLLNGRDASEQQIIEILANRDNKYLVTEFIQMHPELARIYPHSVNTLRMIVFKGDGLTPQIGNAYLRVGSSASGFIDNTAAGGMMAEVDVESGWFGNGQILQDGQVTDHPYHPDTGELIEGVLPGWEQAKQQVLDIARALPQLEYLGFDIAITEDGIKIPEINRFPDYPRINKLTSETTDYLLQKVAEKKRNLGFDKRPPRKPITLPKRGDR